MLIAGIAFYFILTNSNSQAWVIFIVFFLISAIIDFLVNLDPSHTPIKLYDNSITYSDGYQFLQLFKRRGMSAAFFEAEKSFNTKKYEAAIEQCLQLIEERPQKKACL